MRATLALVHVATVLAGLALATSCATDMATDSHPTREAGGVQGYLHTIPVGGEAGVRIRLAGVPHSTVTTANGEFSLSDIPVGEYELTAEKDGYSTARAKVAVVAQEEVEVNVTIAELCTVVGHVQVSWNQNSFGFEADSVVVSAATGQSTTVRPRHTDQFEESRHLFSVSGLGPGSNWLQVRWYDDYVVSIASAIIYVPPLSPGQTYAVPYTVLYRDPSTDLRSHESVSIWGSVTPARRGTILLLWKFAERTHLLSGSATVDDDGQYVVPIDVLTRDERASTVYLEARYTYLTGTEVVELSSGAVPVSLGSYRAQPVNLWLSDASQ